MHIGKRPGSRGAARRPPAYPHNPDGKGAIQMQTAAHSWWRSVNRWFFAVLLVSALAVPACSRRPTGTEEKAPTPKAAGPAATGLTTAAQPGFAEAGGRSLADVAEACIDGVVNISSTRVIRTPGAPMLSPFFNDPFFRRFFGPGFFRGVPRERRERSLGSGVIVSEKGIVLTNNHVVEHAEEIVVTLADKREFKAKILGTDPKTDVAVIQLEGKVEGLRPIPFGDSRKLRLAELVLAIGNPFGLDHTVTMGIVSAKGRANVGIADYEDFIQTDAAINPGNSGGALINLKGELVGLNTAIISNTGGYQGIGFAIPSNMAKAVMESLIEKGKVVRGWLGVTIQDVNDKLAAALGLKEVRGVLVSDVLKGSPAEKAGLKRGDVILEVNGEVMDSSGELRNRIATLGAGTKAKLTILRKGERETLTVTLGEMPKEIGKSGAVEPREGLLNGLRIEPLAPPLRRQFGIPEDVREGVVVVDVEPGTPAAASGLEPGDVILEVNQEPVRNVKDFTEAYRKSDEQVLLLVQRRGNTLYIVLSK